MMDDAYRYYHDDGSTYSVDIRLPADSDIDPYRVELIQQMPGDEGESDEQRYALGAYRSYGEAEEHLYEAEQQLRETGLQDFQAQLVPTLSKPEYYFGLGIGPNNEPALEAVKTWLDSTERQFDTFTVGEYGTFEAAQVDQQELESLRVDRGLQAAMHLAESMAVSGGYLEAERQDGRLFTDTDAPLDPFLTQRQIEQQQRERVDQFQQLGDRRAVVLLEPIEPDVNYSFEIAATSPDTVDLLAVKWWQENDNYRSQAVPVNSYERTQEGAAFRDFLELNEIAQEQDKATALQTARAFARDNELLERDTLFTQGPADEFTQAVDASMSIQPPVKNLYWYFDTLPAVDPDGEPLGHALHMVVYDGIEHDPEMIGTPAILEDETFRMLEVAHFETTEAADKFTGEFGSYLVPGLLDAPELAEEVARLEELPVEWRTLDEQEREQYRNLELTLTRDPADWHPYNPSAEQDARINAEGLYTDPIHQFTAIDEDKDNLKVEPAAPDFDL